MSKRMTTRNAAIRADYAAGMTGPQVAEKYPPLSVSRVRGICVGVHHHQEPEVIERPQGRRKTKARPRVMLLGADYVAWKLKQLAESA